MEECKWQRRIMTIDAEVNARIAVIDHVKKKCECLVESRAIKKQIRQIFNERNKLLTSIEKESNSSLEL